MTVTTTAFESPLKDLIKDNGVAGIALVVTEHPIAGHNPEGIRKKADKDFPSILKAATQWQPGK